MDDFKPPNPQWATAEVHAYGNRACKVCGKVQAPHFRQCIYCCPHDSAHIFVATADDGGTYLSFECKRCGNTDDGFDRYSVERNYELTRKGPRISQRQEVAEIINAVLDPAIEIKSRSGPENKSGRWHYGRKELRDLLDFIYGGPPADDSECIK